MTSEEKVPLIKKELVDDITEFFWNVVKTYEKDVYPLFGSQHRIYFEQSEDVLNSEQFNFIMINPYNNYRAVACWIPLFLIPDFLINNNSSNSVVKYREDSVKGYYVFLYAYQLIVLKVIETINKGKTYMNEDFVEMIAKVLDEYLVEVRIMIKSLVRFLVTVCCFSIVFYKDAQINSYARIYALKIWGSVDSDGLLFYKNHSSVLKLTDTLHDALPSSFFNIYSNWNRNEELRREEIMANPILKSYIGNLWGNKADNVKELRVGLRNMMFGRKLEYIQVVRTLIYLNVYIDVLLETLLSLNTFTPESCEIYFSKKASFRNQGLVEVDFDATEAERIRKIFEDMPKSKITVNDKCVREDDHRLAQNLKKIIENHPDFDYERYFFYLQFSAFSKWEDIRLHVESHFRRRSLNYHGDKTFNGKEDAQKILSNAKDCFSNQTNYFIYRNECFKRIGLSELISKQ